MRHEDVENLSVSSILSSTSSSTPSAQSGDSLLILDQSEHKVVESQRVLYRYLVLNFLFHPIRPIRWQFAYSWPIRAQGCRISACPASCPPLTLPPLQTNQVTVCSFLTNQGARVLTRLPSLLLLGPDSWKQWSLNTVVFSSCFWKEISRVIDWLREMKITFTVFMSVEPPSWNYGCQTQNIEIKMCVI